MKGYYVIGYGDDEPIEFVGKGAKNRAIKKAKELYKNGCEDVFIQRFDDDNPDGYFADEPTIFIKNII